jgi:hypothetical protein
MTHTKDEALKLALAAIESEGWCDTEVVITAIKQALAAPVQEPVAIPDAVRKIAKAMQKDGYRGPLSWARTVIDFVATYKSPPAAQPAPVLDGWSSKKDCYLMSAPSKTTPRQ